MVRRTAAAEAPQPIPLATTQAELVNQLAHELAQARRTLAGVQRRLGSTTHTLQARTLELNETRAALALLLATLDASEDGILAVGHFGRAVHCNQRFAQLWRVPADKMDGLNEGAVLALQLAQVRDPAGFLQAMEARKQAPELEHVARVELTDGRQLAGRLLPHHVRGQRVGWVSCWRAA